MSIDIFFDYIFYADYYFEYILTTKGHFFLNLTTQCPAPIFWKLTVLLRDRTGAALPRISLPRFWVRFRIYKFYYQLLQCSPVSTLQSALSSQQSSYSTELSATVPLEFNTALPCPGTAPVFWKLTARCPALPRGSVAPIYDCPCPPNSATNITCLCPWIN